MKKNILIFSLCSLISSGFSQNVPIDFETGGFGANWTWSVFENEDNPRLEIIDNPDKSGLNTSNKVAKFTARSAGNPWAGCESEHGRDLGSFSFNASNSTLKIMVWKSVISDVGVKFATADNWALIEKKVANTTINQWEELTFDFSSHITEAAGRIYDQIIVFPDFRGRTADEIIYFDNITIGTSTTLNTPLTAAPSPTMPSSDVISIFSDAYTNRPVNTFRTDWSSSNFEEISLDGNKTLKYSQLDFVGIETVGNNTIDASDMQYVHFNAWTPNAALFRFKLVDFGADGNFGGGDDSEHEIVVENPNMEEWINVSWPLNSMTGLRNRSHLAQYIFSGQPVGSTTLYIDNIYFSKEANSSVATISPIKGKVYPNPVDDQFNIELTSTTPIHHYSIYTIEGKELIKYPVNDFRISASIDVSYLPSGIYTLCIHSHNGPHTYKFVKQ
jgi:hypothetical protein